MNVNSLYGIKQSQSHGFDNLGHSVPLTWVRVDPATIVYKTNHNSIQVALGSKKKLLKPQQGFLKNLSQPISPKYIRELKIEETPDSTEVTSGAIGSQIKVADVLHIGDKVKVTGTGKGKGFAGVVKRHGFAGGPKTHGQSNRLRHAGSIGQTTTPGRVYKGKRMAGHMGVHTVTVLGLSVFDVKPEENLIAIRGLVPGAKNGLLKITKSDR